MIDQTQAPPAPAAPGRRPDAVEFFRHAASIGEFDIAAFAVALHELMGRQGNPGAPLGRRTLLTDEELWGNVTAGLNWLEGLHSVAPSGADAAELMQNRLQGDDPDSLKRDLERARQRAKWCGGMPLWLVTVNLVAAMFCTLTAAVLLLRGPSVVDAAPSQDFATPAELRALEQRIEALQDDHAFVVERLHRKLERQQAEATTTDD